MKAQTYVTAAAVISSVVIALAAEKKADSCTEAYDKALVTCNNEKANCKARGSEEFACQQRFDACKKAAEKARKACEEKSKPSAPPQKPGRK